MAEEKDDIDLNELDSIDALLEEAEQALEEAEPEVSGEAADSPTPDLPDDEASDVDGDSESADAAEPEAAPETDSAPETDGAVSESDTESEPEPETETSVQAEAADQTVADDDAPVDAEGPPSPPPEPEPVKAVEEEAPLPEALKKHGTVKKNAELTDADMDKLKKLILAFGISLIVMVLVGWGLSIWAAVAASTTHLDEDTMALLEEIKTGVEHVAVKSEKQDKTLAAVERKIDALSFQLEQLNGDLGKLEEALKTGGASAKTGAGTDGHGHGEPVAKPAAHATPAAATTTTTTVVAGVDPDLKKTLGSINSRLIRTQKKVGQVYTRLVKLQAQYRAMLAAVKKVEKGLKAAKKPGQKKPQLRQPYYQYQAPAGDYPFDPAHVDSYP